ncbi:HAD family hydrolase [Caldivirga sp. UBA161]|uniref:HAD family hydrolase n=1 Tax=Caldivirga sp. UBA161 TaxID=1915569 RepID=UPI0025C101AD|nr:HAD family hydrolase [Caldivirga sp. UBA161]
MAEKTRVITFDVYQTVLEYGDALIKEIGEAISKYYREVGYSVDSSVVTDYYRLMEREVRVNRVMNLLYTPPTENIRRLVKRIGQRYGIPFSNRLVNDLQTIIADTVINSQNIKVIEGVEEVFSILKEEDWLVGIVSNVIFWPGRVSRALLTRFGLWRFIDYAVFSDEVGYPKPHPIIFETLINSLVGDRIPDVAAHVGDNIQEDFVGALMYGIVGVLYDPDGVYTPVNSSPYEAIKCKAYIIRRTKDVLTLVDALTKCS